jgi:hypothetical protein
MPRRCGEEKRMRVENRHRKEHLSTNRKLILYFPTTTKARFSQNKPRCGSSVQSISWNFTETDVSGLGPLERFVDLLCR